MDRNFISDTLTEKMTPFCNRIGFKLEDIELLFPQASVSNTSRRESEFMIRISREGLAKRLPESLDTNYLLPDELSLSLSSHFTNSDSHSSIPALPAEIAEKLISDYLLEVFTATILCHTVELDCLTGLLNKKALLKRLDKSISGIRQLANMKHSSSIDALASSESTPLLCLLICDIDDFKMFNSLYGYIAGDAVINRVAAELVRTFDKSLKPVLSRYGGEEFIALFHVSCRAEAWKISEMFRRAVARRARKTTLSFLRKKAPRLARMMKNVGAITVSSGLIILDPHTTGKFPVTDHSAVIDCATAAMSAAKASGKNRTILYDDILKNHCRIAEILPGGREVRLNLGSLHGIRPGMEFEIIDSNYDGHSPYLQSEGRERNGVKPRRSKGFARVNSQDSKSLEVQEKISFAKIHFTQNNEWPVKPGDQAIFTGIVVPALPSAIATALEQPFEQPNYFGIMTLTQKGSQGKGILAEGMNLSMDTIEASFESVKSRGFFTLTMDGEQIFILSGGISLSALKKSFVHAAKCIRNQSGGVFSLLGCFANLSEHKTEPSKLAVKLRDLMFFQENTTEPKMLVFDAKSANLLGRWHFFKGELKAAEELFREARILEPGAWEPLNNLGTVFMKMDMFEKAKHYFDKALELSNDKASDVLSNLGFLHLIAGWNPSRAVKYLDRAISSGASDQTIVNNLAIALIREGTELSRARSLAERAVQMNQSSAPCQHTLLMAHLAEGNFEKAYEIALVLIPMAHRDKGRIADYYHDSAIAAYKAGFHDKAATWASRAVSIYPPLEDSPQLCDILIRKK
ncbi:MAG: hypothetical protein CVV64_08010 [Candidatus Wallbacteria bacterium HGW-Wallbacteria-1]|jgi:diguanylate cyclase (GGDEF)-like protein|uniref:GGDEF domain-containing protein n=1 Tax=Candidatus Wallbacteria bacterium HGW-Wallbacteria-1 TaxID=2013854 RepID=A0A2N1PR54_9BACT|nr:MAG: hypothetical protein CVV64_08010 [Candidatus Wallbacteria bacterium HGW-Wallbacteria-1]